MLIYRFLCACVLAWAVALVLLRPEAAPLLRSMPEMSMLGPIAAAYVGGFTLAVRQGWGVIVALANGIWAGLLSIAVAGVLYIAVDLARAIAAGEISGLGRFFELFGETVDLLLANVGRPQLLMLSLAATAGAGVLTELIHWLMVRVRSRRRSDS